MCIIVFKKQGLDLLPENKIDICFSNNKDGAGFAVQRNGSGKIEIHKGFMTVDTLKAGLEDAQIRKNDLVVYHFRIHTSGGIRAEMTHPFPISAKKEDLYATRLDCDRAFIHNGVLGKGDKDFSDTQLYIKNVLSKYKSIPDNLENILFDIKKCRVVIMSAKGSILMGEWEQDGGYLYSNTSFRYSKTAYASTYGYMGREYDYSKTYSHIACPSCGTAGTLRIYSAMYASCTACRDQYRSCENCGEWVKQPEDWTYRMPIYCSEHCRKSIDEMFGAGPGVVNG